MRHAPRKRFEVTCPQKKGWVGLGLNESLAAGRQRLSRLRSDVSTFDAGAGRGQANVAGAMGCGASSSGPPPEDEGQAEEEAERSHVASGGIHLYIVNATAHEATLTRIRDDDDEGDEAGQADTDGIIKLAPGETTWRATYEHYKWNLVNEVGDSALMVAHQTRSGIPQRLVLGDEG